MADNKDVKVKDETVVSESDRQEAILREQFKAKKRKKRIRKIITWIVVLLVIVVGYIWYSNYSRQLEEQRQAALARTSQVQVPVTMNVYTATVDLSGYVQAYDIQEARFRATGPITAVNVEEGDSVPSTTRTRPIPSRACAASCVRPSSAAPRARSSC